MTGGLLMVQALNGLQYGVLLFLVAAGLTLVFGVMDFVNLAHGVQYMLGAYLAATLATMTGSFWGGVLLGLAAALLFGLVWNGARVLLGGGLELLPGLRYPLYRLAILLVGLLVALLLWLLIERTRAGALVRAGASNAPMLAALGVDTGRLFLLVFSAGSMLAGFAGAMAAPILSVEPNMGETVLILAFVVIVIGGAGSIRGAFLAALLVGLVETLGRSLLPDLLRIFLAPGPARQTGAALGSMLVYLLMAVILALRPRGLFPVRAG